MIASAHQTSSYSSLIDKRLHNQMQRSPADCLPAEEAPLVRGGNALRGIDANWPGLAKFRKQWNQVNAKIDPPLE